MDGKIEQRVCIKFCVNLGKSATKTLEMLREAFGEHSLSRTAVFNYIHVSRPVECQLKITKIHGDQAPAERQKMLKKFKNSSMKSVAEQYMSSLTPLESVM
jgi:superfamily II DNA/RNA helicase